MELRQRSQRPSEPSDERSGSSYYGYPSSSGASPAISGGADDYGQSTYGGGGSYGQNYQYNNASSYEKKHRGGAGMAAASSSHNPFKEKKSPLCSNTIILCLLAIALMILSIDTFVQYRSFSKVMLQYSSVTDHIEGTPEYDDDDNEATDNFESNPQIEQRELQTRLHSLSTTQANLRQSLSEYTSHLIPKMNSEINSLRHAIEAIEKENGEKSKELDALRLAGEGLTREIGEIKTKYEEKHKLDGKLTIPRAGPGGRTEEGIETVEELERYVQEREDVLWDKIDGLESRMRGQSRIEVEEWFGKGPHKVEIEIEYPRVVEDIEDPNEWPRVRGVFLIELAPLDLMPVTVNLFLQQVHHKLWNGCAFVINAMHILQAGPHKFVNERYVPNHKELMRKFTDSKLDKMPFQEYHEDYPHDQYTLGYAGRPGGPDFYINKINNSKNHGPGGQKIHDLHEEADPCFGKVIKGTELLDEMNKIPVDYKSGHVLNHHVQIVDARIVTEEHNPLEEHEQSADQRDELVDPLEQKENEAARLDSEIHRQGNEEHQMPERYRPGPGPTPGI